MVYAADEDFEVGCLVAEVEDPVVDVDDEAFEVIVELLEAELVGCLVVKVEDRVVEIVGEAFEVIVELLEVEKEEGDDLVDDVAAGVIGRAPAIIKESDRKLY